MPELNSTLHLDMLRGARARTPDATNAIYGLHWGDPDDAGPLRIVRDRWLYPYIRPDHAALEIGPGGGRWTRYLLSFGRVVCVDYHQELLNELSKNYRAPHLELVRNHGADLPGIAPASIDFVFSFGVFVHLDAPIRNAYLTAIKEVLSPGGCAVVQYSDKTKAAARASKGFAENTPDAMRRDVTAAGFTILEENLTLLPHSAIMRFAL